MTRLEFSDGISFETSGKPRIESRFDGWYVVGGGSLIPVSSRREAEATLREALQDWEKLEAKRNKGER